MKRFLLTAIIAGLLAGCVNDIPSKYDHSTVNGSNMTKVELVAKLGMNRHGFNRHLRVI